VMTLPDCLKRRKTNTIKLERKENPIKLQKGKILGKGASGVVYKALDQISGSLFAIKQISLDCVSAKQKQLLSDELKLLESLEHPNVIRFYGAIMNSASLQIVMEYVDGKSIGDLVKDMGSFSETVIRKYMIQILKGLSYLHNKQVIHRDIKGKNLLLTKDGLIKLVDFGSAKSVDGALKEQGVSLSYHFTPLWVAPEVATGKYNCKVDIWSAGCTMIEMATGKDPWSEEHFENASQALFFIAQPENTPKLPQTLGSAALDFLAQALSRNPELRPSAEDLLKHPFLAGS